LTGRIDHLRIFYMFIGKRKSADRFDPHFSVIMTCQ